PCSEAFTPRIRLRGISIFCIELRSVTRIAELAIAASRCVQVLIVEHPGQHLRDLAFLASLALLRTGQGFIPGVRRYSACVRLAYYSAESHLSVALNLPTHG